MFRKNVSSVLDMDDLKLISRSLVLLDDKLMKEINPLIQTPQNIKIENNYLRLSAPFLNLVLQNVFKNQFECKREEIGGTMPENLPVAENIKKVEQKQKRLEKLKNKVKKLDK